MNKQLKTISVIKDTVFYTCMVLLAILFLFPIVYMIAASTKSQASYVSDAGTLMMFIPDFKHIGTMFDNYKSVITEYGIWRNALNSFIYAGIVIVVNVIVNGLAGYVMAKMRFPGKRMFSALIIFLIVVPVETSIIPLYAIVKIMLKLNNNMSVLGVILPAAISIFNIFLFMQFFEGIPKEYEEAAGLDGCTKLGIFFKIILPLSKPIVATIAVFCFIGVWNDYLWPAMILDRDLRPIQATLITIQSMQNITTGRIMAALVVTSVPIFVVYIVAQKYIVQGFGSAGLKM